MLPFVLLLCALLYGMFILLHRLLFPGQIAAIEQLRKDSQKIQIAQSHEVLSQITQWNQNIAAYKKYRTIWWLKLIIPQAWERVEFIEIPAANPVATSHQGH